jgi:hypothetical protein
LVNRGTDDKAVTFKVANEVEQTIVPKTKIRTLKATPKTAVKTAVKDEVVKE